MAKRTIDMVGDTHTPPDAKRPKLSPPSHTGSAMAAAASLAIAQRAGFIQMSQKADAPFRLDSQGEIDCSIDWCTYAHPEYSRASKHRVKTRIIEVFLTPDKLLYPQSVATFNGTVRFAHGNDKIRGRIPFLSPWVQYEITYVEDQKPQTHYSHDASTQCTIIQCRWKIPPLDDMLLTQLLYEVELVTSQDSVDAIRAEVVKLQGYDEITDTYDPKVIIRSIPDPKNAMKLQNSSYMALRYCAPAVLLYGHANVTRTSYASLIEIIKCLRSPEWYHLFFQWFKRIPGISNLPQESRFLRELTLEDLPFIKTYFCIQPSQENLMLEDCIKLYHRMRNGPHKNRDTLCHLRTLLKAPGISTPENVLMPFATKKAILRSEEYNSLPGRWILTYGDFDAEKTISSILIDLKKKESSRERPSEMFDMEYIEKHKKLDDVQKGILRDIINPRNPRRILFFTGQAGSGKTTLIKAMLESAGSYMEKHAPPPPAPEPGKPIKPHIIPDPPIGVFTAYGYMAATIRNSTGHHTTMTMSRAIAIMDIEENVSAKIELQDIKFVIIDEVSTVNMSIIATLLSGMSRLERIFFFGDPNQMPPIERGSICECLMRIFKAVDIEGPKTITQNPDCTIFNLKKNYRQAGKEILINNFKKILNSDPDIDFKIVTSLKEFRETSHPFIVIPISEHDNSDDVPRAINIIAQEYLQSADDSQRIMLMAQRHEDVDLLKTCLQNCDTYIRKLLLPIQQKQATLEFQRAPNTKPTVRNNNIDAQILKQQQKEKSRPLVVGELVRTTANYYSKTKLGVPNVEYVQTGTDKTVPLVTSSLTNNDIGILHAIYDVNVANGRIIKQHTSTASPQTRSTKDFTYTRVMVLKPPKSKIVKELKKKSKNAKNSPKSKSKKNDTEYLFINSREYALYNVVPRDVTTITVSQGQESEVSCIYLPAHMFQSKTFERSQLYTGVTRGKERVILITPVINGRLPAVENILKNDTIPGKTNFVQKYQDSLRQAQLV